MQRVFLVKACVILTAVVLITLAGNVLAHSGELAEGEGSYLLGPGLPTVFTFDSGSMSCAVAWGTMGAPGPGPFSDVEMGLQEVNFGMLVYSVEVTSFVVDGNRVHMTGKARSITTVNEEIVENAIYRFEVEAINGGPPEQEETSERCDGPLHQPPALSSRGITDIPPSCASMSFKPEENLFLCNA